VAQLVAQLTPISMPEETRFSAEWLGSDMSPSRRGVAMSHLVLADFGHDYGDVGPIPPTARW
jgi:hypothetical protein